MHAHKELNINQLPNLVPFKDEEHIHMGVSPGAQFGALMQARTWEEGTILHSICSIHMHTYTYRRTLLISA